MAQGRRLIVGLGNPDRRYTATRHNVGFLVVDAIAARCRASFAKDGRARSLVAQVRIRGRKATLAKPQTYMNASGAAVKALSSRHALAARDILIVVDDIYLPLGALRLRASGGAGGHNGMQDITDRLGTDEFPRLRLGIGSGFGRGRQSDYVLSPFADEEKPLAERIVERAADAARVFVTDGIVPAMNRFNRGGNPDSADLSTSP